MTEAGMRQARPRVGPEILVTAALESINDTRAAAIQRKPSRGGGRAWRMRAGCARGQTTRPYLKDDMERAGR
mgnify:CR=1 FL=1